MVVFVPRAVTLWSLGVLAALASVPFEASGDPPRDATMSIAGAPAALASVYVQLRWLLGVDSLVLSGRALSDGRALHERLAR